ncbi:MAG TPA: hypothetical protein VET23_05485 [Chitinophagaceae bacterium]|nr:hypothetical protein [Chitinophagaceae bacterium]
MKKIILISLSLFLTVIFFSCKKEATDIPIGTISVNINGTASTFNIQAKASRPITSNGGYAIQINGYKKDPFLSGTNLSFRIESPIQISAGTYTENALGDPIVTMSHFVDIFVGYGSGSSNYGSVRNPVSISITEITSSSIKGIFKGELHASSYTGSPGETEILTNGMFYVSF